MLEYFETNCFGSLSKVEESDNSIVFIKCYEKYSARFELYLTDNKVIGYKKITWGTNRKTRKVEKRESNMTVKYDGNKILLINTLSNKTTVEIEKTENKIIVKSFRYSEISEFEYNHGKCVSIYQGSDSDGCFSCLSITKIIYDNNKIITDYSENSTVPNSPHIFHIYNYENNIFSTVDKI
jgi:hypothetical protein